MTARDLLDTVWIIPALPLFGAVLLLLVGKRIGEPKAGWIATALLGLAFIWSVVMFGAMLSLPDETRTNTVNLFTWFPAGALRVNIGFLTDQLSVTWIMLVTGVGSLIHLYAIGYMHGDARFTRFFAYLNLFAASMLILVLGSSFLVTFLGWEGVGLCSYLLISHWFERNRAAVAGKKAFVANRVGDFGFMIAMFFIIGSVGSLDYAAMNLRAGSLPHTTVTAIALLLFVGCIGKSAQIPLHVWLPDAMEGPTPVSALIHAATMVTAGIYLLCRAHPFFEASGDAMTVVAWVGAGTALLAGTVALVQPDIKRVLAYSTVSQLGYMFLACGIGAYQAAVFMVLAHACYKGTLFLGAGSVIHGNRDNQDLRRLGGLRKFMPFTAGAFILAWLAISGIPPFSGFFAKDEIISDAYFTSDYALWIIAVAAAAITAIYMTRETLLTFFGNERFRAALGANPVEGSSEEAAEAPVAAHAEVHAGAAHEVHEISPISPTVDYGDPPAPARLTEPPHEMPWTMVVPSVLLAGLAAVIGFINMPFTNFEFLTEWLDPVFRGVTEHGPDSFVEGATLDVVSVTIACLGILFAWTLYRRGLDDPEVDPLNQKLGPFGRLFGHAYYYDEGISWLVDRPLRRAASWLATGFDLGIIDGAVNGLARLVRGAAGGLRRVQTGLVRQYALGIVLGVVLLLLYALARSGFEMDDFPILTAIIVTPILGALLVLCTPARRPELARALGYMTSMATLGLAGWLLWDFQTGVRTFQFVEENRWFDALGVGYIVGVDGFSIFMVSITVLLFPIGLLASAQQDQRVKAYTFWFLLLEGVIMGIFLSLDLICFFIFWEAMLVPMYFLIAGWGSERRVYAAMKFFIYTVAGSAFLLASILVLGFLHQNATGNLTFDYRVLVDWNGLATSTEKWLFLGFMVAFVVKAPLFPFHTWLPDVHTEAPTAGSVVLAGVILKMGAYGFLRFSFELFPAASVYFAPLIMTLAVIGIVYGSIVAAMQTDVKRVIAFSSVAHMGFILLGIFSITIFGLDGAAFNMLSHPLTTGALFLVVGMLYERRHTREISEFGGVWKSAPVLTAFFLIATFAGIGLPGFSGFVGEFLALVGAFISHRWWAIVATTGVILAAVYMLWMFQRVFTGVPEGDNAKLRDVSLREVFVVAPLLAISLFIGIYPKPVIDRVEPTVKRVISNFERKTDYEQPEQDRVRHVVERGAKSEPQP